MNTTIHIFIISVFISTATTALGDFQNMDFESANISKYPQPDLGPFPIGDVFPGWNAYYGSDQTSYVMYNNFSLGASLISLYDNKAIYSFIYSTDGDYSASLDSRIDPVSLAQTGTIPSGSLSIVFLLRNVREGDLEVSFDGHVLPYVKTWSEPAFDVCAADISAYVGKTGELRFTENSGWDVIDDIQFSSDAVPVVPEPSTVALFGTGALAALARLAFKKA